MNSSAPSNDTIALAVFGLLVVVGLFAWMPKPRWLDRIWLGLIAISFVIYFPIFTILKIEDYGAWNVGLAYAALFLYGMHRRWPIDDPPQPPRPRGSR